MNDSQRGGGRGRWKFLKGKLGFNKMACCSGGIWGLGASSNMRIREEEDDDLEMQLQENVIDMGPTNNNTNDIDDLRNCVDHDHHHHQVPPVASGINLAMALAAERHFRSSQDWEVGPSESTSNNSTISGTANSSRAGVGTPMRVSLMRLLEEGDGLDFEEDEEEEEEESEKKENKGGVGNDTMCCVCMGRKKGAAFIPCGHTFCRVCSRELWLNRGSCPLCNRSILEILDIF